MLDQVHAEVRRLASGRRRLRFFAVLGRSLFWGLVALALGAYFLGVVGSLIGLGVVCGLALVAGAAAAAFVPVDSIAVAKRYDDRVGTHDLLSSSLELPPDPEAVGAAFVAAVGEDAARATGRADAMDLYPTRVPPEVHWIPAPLVAAALAVLLPILLAPKPPEPTAKDLATRARAAERLQELVRQRDQDRLTVQEQKRLDAVKNLAERIQNQQASKKDLLAEVARLQSQLDKDKEQLTSKKLELEKNAAKLASGEDTKDAKRDMDAGRFREAANKVKKKAADLRKQLEEELKKTPPDRIKIEQLTKRLAEVKELLADLEQLDALGSDLGFLVEVEEGLDRVEGELGKLQDYDGDTWDEAQLGPRPKGPGERRQPQPGDKLLVYPSSDAGEGHAEKFKSEKGQRALTEREEEEARLRESKKGKSRFGQIRTANDGSKSRTEFGESALAAKRAAEDSIHRQNIPAGYRSYIRRYFEIMQPDDGPSGAEVRK
jgi:hypothetical protein